MNDRRTDPHAMLASLGQASRFRLALCLLEGERCVGDLALAIGLSQSCTTRHVQALERAGVVRSRRDGKRVLVGLERERDGLAELMGWLAADAGAAFGAGSAPASRARPAPQRQAGRTERAAAARRRAASRPETRSRSAPAPPAMPAPAPREEAPPRHEPASGTHPAPEQAPAPTTRRYQDTLEDFLL